VLTLMARVSQTCDLRKLQIAPLTVPLFLEGRDRDQQRQLAGRLRIQQGARREHGAQRGSAGHRRIPRPGRLTAMGARGIQRQPPPYGGTPGTATALTAYAATHTASTPTGRDRRHHSATPPISAAASPRTSPATPARRSGARTELTARGPASCSAVTSTTSSTFPARAQRRRGAGGLTAAPVSHRQGTSYQALHARRGRPAYSP